MAKKKSLKARLQRFLLKTIAAILLLIALFVLTVSGGLWGEVPSRSDLEKIELDRASEVYTSDSVLIGKFYLFDRQPIPRDLIPQHTIDALISIEDQRFYTHTGVDFPSLFRVFFKTILLGDNQAGGGSTLDQQLVKNLYPRKKGGRLQLVADKLREMIGARRLEKTYNKEEILHLYLNTVSFGDNTFGIESAARKFFSKSANALKPEESAVLIGMLKGTYSYNPRLFPEKSLVRRNLVIDAMQRNGYLSPGIKDSLKALPLVLGYRAYGHDQGLAPYFREEVRKEMTRWIGSQETSDSVPNLYTSGLKIYTTLDSRLQSFAESAVRTHIGNLQKEFEEAYGSAAPWKSDQGFIDVYARDSEAYQKMKEKGLDHESIMDSLRMPREIPLNDLDGSREQVASSLDSLLYYARMLQAGNLAVDAKSGAVLVWVGGIDFERFKFDHVSQIKRQVGSTFKPIVYTAGMESGLEPCSYFSAREVRYTNLEDWTPSNAGDSEEAYLNYSMSYALTHSVNTVSVKVLEETGIPKVLKQAAKMGIDSDLPEQPSLALGTGSVPMQEMASAYSTYLNERKPVVPYLIERIDDSDGTILFEHEPEIRDPAYSETTRRQMLGMLQSVADEGTASRLRSQYGFKGPIAGKTGTTQKNRDAWFIGMTPRLVHVSWVGLDHYHFGFPNTRIGQGANAALPLFALWYRELRKDPELRYWTEGTFGLEASDGKEDPDCPPVKKDGFFKRLFTNPNKAKARKFKKGEGS